MSMHTHRLPSPLVILATLTLSTALGTGCRGGEDDAGLASADDDGTGEASGDDGASSFDPELLNCPTPGSVPFTLESNAFADGANQTLVDENPRIKDEAGDILGNPGGPYGYTRMGVTDSTGADALRFVGKKARSTNDAGLVSMPITSEYVSLWSFDGSEWFQAARVQTDGSGDYDISGVDGSPNRFQPHYAVLEGDQSCAAHYSWLLPTGAKIFISDIDETLTLSDEELFSQIADVSYDPVENSSASTMMAKWAEKGYSVVYLTARPHVFRAETRSWLTAHGFPPGPVISANSLVTGDSARMYKGAWVNRLTDDFGWEIIAAYGNATSDIDAYEDGGIPKDITFIIGENAGVAETQAIDNNDFSTHITEFVDPYPAND